MEALFLLGAIVIGLMRRHRAAVAVALGQLAALATAGAAYVMEMPVSVLGAAAIVYLVCVALGLRIYVQGRKLAHEDDRREVHELVGAAAIVAIFEVALGVLVALFGLVWVLLPLWTVLLVGSSVWIVVRGEAGTSIADEAGEAAA